jgi:hypothetical protein
MAGITLTLGGRLMDHLHAGSHALVTSRAHFLHRSFLEHTPPPATMRIVTARAFALHDGFVHDGHPLHGEFVAIGAKLGLVARGLEGVLSRIADHMTGIASADPDRTMHNNAGFDVEMTLGRDAGFEIDRGRARCGAGAGFRDQKKNERQKTRNRWWSSNQIEFTPNPFHITHLQDVHTLPMTSAS